MGIVVIKYLQLIEFKKTVTGKINF